MKRVVFQSYIKEHNLVHGNCGNVIKIKINQLIICFFVFWYESLILIAKKTILQTFYYGSGT